jgi:hypothetical protein
MTGKDRVNLTRKALHFLSLHTVVYDLFYFAKFQFLQGTIDHFLSYLCVLELCGSVLGNAGGFSGLKS